MRCGSGEVADGDLVAVIAADKTGVNFLVASFHGDTEGLQSIPVLEAVHAAVQARNVSGDGAVEAKGAAQETKLIFGLDANVYQEPPGKKPHLHYVDWLESCASLGMATNFGALGSAFDPVACRTTMNARTFCQPQLQKAVRLSEFDKGDCNPKDYVLFYADQFEGVQTSIDKTGDGGFAPGEVPPDGGPVHTPLPSLVWPSDHGAPYDYPQPEITVTTFFKAEQNNIKSHIDPGSVVPSTTNCTVLLCSCLLLVLLVTSKLKYISHQINPDIFKDSRVHGSCMATADHAV